MFCQETTLHRLDFKFKDPVHEFHYSGPVQLESATSVIEISFLSILWSVPQEPENFPPCQGKHLTETGAPLKTLVLYKYLITVLWCIHQQLRRQAHFLKPITNRWRNANHNQLSLLSHNVFQYIQFTSTAPLQNNIQKISTWFRVFSSRHSSERFFHVAKSTDVRTEKAKWKGTNFYIEKILKLQW